METFHFDLTLNLPKDIQQTINQNTNQINIQPNGFQFSISMSKAIIQNIYQLNNQINLLPNIQTFLIPRSITILKKSLLLNELQQVKQQCSSTIPIRYAPQNTNTTSNFYTFKPSITIRQQGILNLTIQQQNIKFTAKIVKKAKFVKNEKLLNIISLNEQSSGLLTMDQSTRVMIEGTSSAFPTIGIWQKNNYSIDHLSTYSKMSSFLNQYHSKKCKFLYSNKQYFYYAKFQFKQQIVPQLYLVTWTQQSPIKYTYEYQLQKLLKKDFQIINFPYQPIYQQQSADLQFTLRNKSEQKLFKSIDFCSPIKFSNKDIQTQLFDQQTYDSPKFQRRETNLYQTQKQALIAIINQQSDEIISLKQTIENLKYQLKIISEVAIDQKKGKKSDRIVRSPYYQINSTAKAKTRLSESDLKCSFDSSNKNINNLETLDETSIKLLCQKDKVRAVKNVTNQEQPWQKIDFID